LRDSGNSNTPSDWIELYNTADTAVNIANYSISDNPSRPRKWVFGNVIMPPHSHLLLLATGDGSDSIASLPDTLHALTENYWSWSDSRYNPPGRSTISPLQFDELLGFENNSPVYSVRFYPADNTAPGDLGWYSSVLSINVGEENTVYNYTKYIPFCCVHPIVGAYSERLK